ncbi:hypothetical protein ACVIW0_005802 [Bradyrhizobium sp. USDA 4454]
MIRPPSCTDSFGYDKADQPIVVKLKPDVYVFGYEFCHVLQTLIKHGCVPVELIYEDGSALIFIFDPDEKKTELWSGSWRYDKPNIYSIMDPEHRGLVRQLFETTEAFIEFSRSQSPRIELIPGQIQKI